MIRITKSEDLKQLSDCPKISEYLADLLNRLITDYPQYCADCSISQIGAILFLEDLRDFEDYKAMGLYEELNINSFEWIMTFEDYRILCIVVSNDYSLNLVCTRRLYNEWLNSLRKGAYNNEQP